MGNFIGHKIVRLQEVDSTNKALCRQEKSEHPPQHGELLFALDQSHGKGQGSNAWESETNKNLTFSYYLNPRFLKASEQFNLNMAVSLGVYEMVNSYFPKKSIKIKWPNDIYVDQKKISGILINHSITGNSIDHSIVGIGLNVNQTDFPDFLPNPASMKQISNVSYDLEDVLQDLLKYLNNYYNLLKTLHFDELKEAYKYAMFGYYQWLKFRHEREVVVARITGISEFGLLQLETDSKQHIECDLKGIEFII